MTASLGSIGTRATFGGNAYGARIEAGFTLGSDHLYAEPSVGIAYLRTDLDGLGAFGATVEFDTMEGVRALAGLGSAAAARPRPATRSPSTAPPTSSPSSPARTALSSPPAPTRSGSTTRRTAPRRRHDRLLRRDRPGHRLHRSQRPPRRRLSRRRRPRRIAGRFLGEARVTPLPAREGRGVVASAASLGLRALQ